MQIGLSTLKKSAGRSPPDLAASVRDEHFRNEVGRIGSYPFILISVGHQPGPDGFVLCKTQAEVAGFVGELAATPRFSDSLLIRGIERALQQDIYEAGDLFYRWTKSDCVVDETPHVCQPDEKLIHTGYNYPMFAFDCADPVAGSEARTQMLLDVLNTYAGTDGNNAMRFSIMEATALALSRALGVCAKYKEALAAVEKALAVSPSSIHLKAAKHTLRLKVEGKRVPPRLEKFAGDDNGYLKQFVCPLPFERFDIGPNGLVMVCCGHWLPTHIGNFMNQPMQDVLNSPVAKAIRQSVTDGSYKYCNHLDCGSMAQDALPRRDELQHPRTHKAVAEQNYELDGVDQVMFAFDQSCNLSCPSCRTHVITEKVSQSIEKARAVEEKLLPLLPTLRTLHINPAGELFGSKPSRRLLELINDERCPDLRLDIISNGTLFSREEWNKFPGIHNKVRSVRISIDAACKETFEKLRRLGKYDVFLNNMSFLRDLRVDGTLPQLKFSFTYQLDNFLEMKAFVAFCDEMHADFAIFERLQNIAFTQDEYERLAVHLPDHPLYDDFLQVIKDPVFRTKRVWHDFDFPDVDNMSREEARERLTAVPVPS
jgi:MoaA/NifB/PqqE/SkfB family radical SAM enzyme